MDDSDLSKARLHNFKNDYVKNSGYRYIDFAKEVLDYERKEKTRANLQQGTLQKY